MEPIIGIKIFRWLNHWLIYQDEINNPGWSKSKKSKLSRNAGHTKIKGLNLFQDIGHTNWKGSTHFNKMGNQVVKLKCTAYRPPHNTCCITIHQGYSSEVDQNSKFSLNLNLLSKFKVDKFPLDLHSKGLIGNSIINPSFIEPINRGAYSWRKRVWSPLCKSSLVT